MILPYINGTFVDVLINAKDMSNIYRWVILLLLIGIFNIVVTYIYSITSKRFINLLSYELNIKTINHIWNLEYKQVCKFDLSYLMQRIYTDSGVIISFFINNFVALIINGATMIILVFVLWRINPFYLAVSIIFSMVYAIAFGLVRKKLSAKTLKFRNDSNAYYSVLNTQLNNFEDIQIEVSYDHGNKIIKRSFTSFWDSLLSFLRISQRVSSIEGIITLCFQITSFLIGGYQVINKIITIGEFTIINSYFVILLSCITYYFNYGKSYHESVVSYQRLKEIFNLKSDDMISSFIKKDIDNIKINHIQADNLCFNFGNNEVIHNLSIDCNKGDLIAITGKNGSGKTTLLKMLIGLLKPTGGTLLYNLNNSNSFDWKQLRKKQIAFATQSLLCEQIDVSELISDLDFDKLVQLQGEIFGDYNLLNKIIDKKFQDLSLGEKSKLLIIRALSKDSSLLLLDEPTANLDANSSENLINYLLTLKDKITICSTHDYKLIEKATKVVKM